MSTAALSTAGAGQRARRPGRWCGHGHQATLFMGKVPFGRMYPNVWVPRLTYGGFGLA